MVTLLEECRDRFYYKDGKLLYLKTNGPKQIVNTHAGYNNSLGYRIIMINEKAYSEHRLIFLLHNEWLPTYIDHIDRNRSNNLIENLRPATKSQNQVNINLPETNKSGIKGVRLDTKRNKWYAEAKRNNKRYFLGYYDLASEAEKAYNKFSQENDGEFYSE